MSGGGVSCLYIGMSFFLGGVGGSGVESRTLHFSPHVCQSADLSIDGAYSKGKCSFFLLLLLLAARIRETVSAHIRVTKVHIVPS